ncbi:MAG: hypothetical protein J7605_06260 [Variovorax sp.]|nr:hypothetical protein [Variovorax sp.]
MSTQNISSAAIHVVGQYNDAGKTLLNAYRTGAHRLLGGVASHYNSFFEGRELPLIDEDAKARLLGAYEKVTGFLTNRVDIDTGRALALMDRAAETATSGIESLAQASARVEESLGSSIAEVVQHVHEPIASLSVKIADAVAASAKIVESRVAGTAAASQEVETVKAKPATRDRASRTSRALKA